MKQTETEPTIWGHQIGGVEILAYDSFGFEKLRHSKVTV